MSDYLSHIAERASPTPAAVRPALPSRFEPVKTGGAFAAVSSTRETEPIFEIEHDSQPANETGDKNQSIRDRVTAMQSIWTAATISTTPQKREATTNQTSSELDRVRVAEPAVRVFAGKSPTVAVPAAESLHQEPAVWPRTAHPPTSARRQPIAEGDANPASDPLIRAEPKPATLRVVQTPTTATPAGHLLIPPGALVPRAPAARRESATAKTAFATKAEASPAPAIYVTIGRVEVRAILPAVQATQPPARSAPKLSLDDYLRSRNGGGA